MGAALFFYLRVGEAGRPETTKAGSCLPYKGNCLLL